MLKKLLKKAKHTLVSLTEEEIKEIREKQERKIGSWNLCRMVKDRIGIRSQTASSLLTIDAGDPFVDNKIKVRRYPNATGEESQEKIKSLME